MAGSGRATRDGTPMAMTAAPHPLTIWIDADSLPRDLRPLLAKRAVAPRTYESVPVVVRFVASCAQTGIPLDALTRVPPGPGAVDSWIEAHALPGDIIMTRDIPLAERLVSRHMHVLNDRGDIFTADNVAERRSIRDAMEMLRASGIAPPSPRTSQRTAADIKRFADALERLIVRAARARLRDSGSSGDGGR